MKPHFLISGLVLVSSATSAVEYERDIMPIFVKKCAECHSNESGQSKGGFKVDDPDHLFGRLSKNSLVVPGDWDASYLFVTLFRPADHDDAMPPKGKGERLTPAETRLVQQWIAEGAEVAGEKGEEGPMPKKGDLGYIDVDRETSKEALDSFVGMEDRKNPQVWKNREGKEITATLLQVDGDIAILRLANGTVYRYPIDKLSDESREALPKTME